MATSFGAGGFSRRRFVQLASLAAAAGLVPKLALAQAAAASGAPLSVGYVLGSEDLADPLRPDWWAPWRTASTLRAAGESGLAASQVPLQVVPADEIPGDPRLAVVPVRMAVLGLYPEVDDVPGATFDMVLTVHFHTGDPFLPVVPFHAWGWRDDPAASSGSPTRFTVPVERDTGLRMTLDVRQVEALQVGRARSAGGGVRAGAASRSGAASSAARSAWTQETVLSVGVEPGVPTLQRGVYLLGLEPNLWARPADLPAGAFPDELPPSLVVAIEAVEDPIEE